MRQRVPSDVERLMWLVAESNDPNAIADFESRFPEFALELSRRRRMMSDLKGARVHTASDHRIPVFTPRSSQMEPPRKTVWVVSGLALAALAMASYSVTKWATTSPPVLPKVEPVVTEPVKLLDTNVYVPPKQQIQTPSMQNPTSVPPNVQQPTSPQEQPKTLRLTNTSLRAALQMIGEMAGYHVEIAPGFKDQQISIDYNGETTSNMLKDLGAQYGFTPFDQGDGTIIIVPAVDEGPPLDDTNGSDRRLGG